MTNQEPLHTSQASNELEHRYSDNLYKKTIAIIGPYPPPLGGTSVHIKRVAQKLRSQENYVQIFDITCFSSRLIRYAKLIYFLCKTRPDEVQYHTLYNNLLEWFCIISLKAILSYRLILIDHDCRHLYQRSAFFKYILRTTLICVNHHVIIGTTTRASYHDAKIPVAKAASLESPFLPPALSEEQAIWATYPSDLSHFLRTRSPLILANAFRLVLINNQDLYGLDLCIELMHNLREKYPLCGLIIALAQRGNEQYYYKLLNNIKQASLQEYMYFLEHQKELWPLMHKVDLFVRPTRSDSYGISVQEAIFFGTPALASDICKRPSKAFLFKTGDMNDFLTKAQSILSTGSPLSS